MLLDAALFLHIAGGSVAILAGYAALAARKGARPHRVAGDVFVLGMLVMAGFGLLMGIAKGQSGNVLGSVMAAYLVGTGWAAVRPRRSRAGVCDRLAMLLAASLAAAGAGLGALDPSSGPGPGVFYAFGALAALAAALDLKVWRRGGLIGFERVRRHLWRMCTALFVATGSAFLGQRDEIPAALHGPHLFLLALAPLAALVFWTVRSRPRRPRLRAAPAPP
ncbi:MAG: DUF2306 domain-containing protein [Pseudomonadota bacterium]|nr:DUF2306 domain-containing protein [Pseudomonadota bacterium]